MKVGYSLLTFDSVEIVNLVWFEPFNCWYAFSKKSVWTLSSDQAALTCEDAIEKLDRLKQLEIKTLKHQIKTINKSIKRLEKLDVVAIIDSAKDLTT